MEIRKKACAGTLESSDVYVEVAPCDSIKIEVESVVAAQFGEAITFAADTTLKALGVSGAFVLLKDRGALDCVIRARVETAVRRAAGEVQ